MFCAALVLLAAVARATEAHSAVLQHTCIHDDVQALAAPRIDPQPFAWPAAELARKRQTGDVRTASFRVHFDTSNMGVRQSRAAVLRFAFCLFVLFFFVSAAALALLTTASRSRPILPKAVPVLANKWL